MDALSLNLTGLEAYVFPPYQIIGKILQKYQTATSCKLILIAPWWPTMSWFPLLLQLATAPPLRLRTSPTMLRQPKSNVFHKDPEGLALHAWLLAKHA